MKKVWLSDKAKLTIQAARKKCIIDNELIVLDKFGGCVSKDSRRFDPKKDYPNPNKTYLALVDVEYHFCVRTTETFLFVFESYEGLKKLYRGEFYPDRLEKMKKITTMSSNLNYKDLVQMFVSAPEEGLQVKVQPRAQNKPENIPSDFTSTKSKKRMISRASLSEISGMFPKLRVKKSVSDDDYSDRSSDSEGIAPPYPSVYGTY